MSCLHCKNQRICVAYLSLVEAQQKTGILEFSEVAKSVAENCAMFNKED
jgi:hypothetical protein